MSGEAAIETNIFNLRSGVRFYDLINNGTDRLTADFQDVFKNERWEDMPFSTSLCELIGRVRRPDKVKHYPALDRVLEFVGGYIGFLDKYADMLDADLTEEGLTEKVKFNQLLAKSFYNVQAAPNKLQDTAIFFVQTIRALNEAQIPVGESMHGYVKGALAHAAVMRVCQENKMNICVPDGNKTIMAHEKFQNEAYVLDYELNTDFACRLSDPRFSNLIFLVGVEGSGHYIGPTGRQEKLYSVQAEHKPVSILSHNPIQKQALLDVCKLLTSNPRLTEQDLGKYKFVQLSIKIPDTAFDDLGIIPKPEYIQLESDGNSRLTIYEQILAAFRDNIKY